MTVKKGQAKPSLQREEPTAEELFEQMDQDHSGTITFEEFKEATVKAKESPKTWLLAGGLGWLYGIGCCIGPFYGVGVGLTVPGGILAGAGGGLGVVVGIGMGGGFVWGSGKGKVNGLGFSFPSDGMEPPELPTLAELQFYRKRGLAAAQVALPALRGRVTAALRRGSLARQPAGADASAEASTSPSTAEEDEAEAATRAAFVSPRVCSLPLLAPKGLPRPHRLGHPSFTRRPRKT